MERVLIYLMAVVGGAAFLVMVKLMYDMTGHMARMTDQVAVMSADLGRMRGQMETLVGQVGGIESAVGHMPRLAADVGGIRESVSAMSGVIHRSGEQIERLNPLEMMQQIVPPAQRR